MGGPSIMMGYLQPSWKPCKSVPLSPSGIPPPQRIMFWNFEKISSVNIQARIVYLFLPRIPADPYFSLDLSDLFYTNTSSNKEIKRHLIPFLLKNGENQAEISKSHENECQKSVVNDKSFGRPLKISGNFGKYWVKKWKIVSNVGKLGHFWENWVKNPNFRRFTLAFLRIGTFCGGGDPPL